MGGKKHTVNHKSTTPTTVNPYRITPPVMIFSDTKKYHRGEVVFCVVYGKVLRLEDLSLSIILYT